MKRALLIIITAIIAILCYKYYTDHVQDQVRIEKESKVILSQLKNVSKLVVTEGHFAEVMNYEDTKNLLEPYFKNDFFKSKKTALIVVNAQATVSYDLSKIDYAIDDNQKTLTINSLPEPEIQLHPDIEYFDMQEGFMNEFEAEDYNKIKATVKESLLKKVEASTLVTNAEHRLLTELSRLFVLTNSMGWTLVYHKKPVESLDDLSLQGDILVD